MNFYPNNNNYFSNYPAYPQNNNPLSILQGKIVENQEIVKTTEIPFNSFGVFPKGDFSEIYIKTWNNITCSPYESAFIGSSRCSFNA